MLSLFLNYQAGSQPVLRTSWTNAVDALSYSNANGSTEEVAAPVITKLQTLVSSESNAEVQEALVKTFGRWLSKSSQLSPDAAKIYSSTLADAKKQDKAKWYLESLYYAASGCTGQKLKQIPDDLLKPLFQIFDKVKQRTTLRSEGLLTAFFFAKVSVEAGDSPAASQIAKAGVWEYLFSDQSFFLSNPAEFVTRLDSELFPILMRFVQYVISSDYFGKHWKTNKSFFSLLLEAAVQGSWPSRQLALKAIREAHQYDSELSEKLLSTFSNFLAQVRTFSYDN